MSTNKSIIEVYPPLAGAGGGFSQMINDRTEISKPK